MKVHIPPELVRRYDRPGPRYTSYPTVPVWRSDFTARDQVRALHRLAAQAPPALSLYLHFPFCVKRCAYCGCNAVPLRAAAEPDAYLDRVEREIALVSRYLGKGRRVVQMHWGGGTPNLLDPPRLERAMALVRDAFELDPKAEVSIEVDPRLGGTESARSLRALGFNRISLGIQDFDRGVQSAIGRIQPETMTRAFFRACRAAGFESVNADLVYGLPGQTLASFGRTLDKVLELGPDRVACFGYAHVPWIRPNQRAVDARLLPAPEVKFALFREAVARFTGAGYAWIGLDHFARPGDALSRAAAERRLHRNFMGYTTHLGLPVIAFGMSGISDLGESFYQNDAELSGYQAAVDRGALPVVRGIRLTPEDRFRQRAILHLMCNLELPYDPCALGWTGGPPPAALPFHAYEPFEADGLVVLEADRVRVTDRGRFFIRNLCMVLDAYLEAMPGRPIFSRTV